MKSRFCASLLAISLVAASALAASSSVAALPPLYEQEAWSPLSVGNGPHGVAYDPTSDRVYVANREDDTVTIVDSTDGAIITTISSEGDEPFAVAVAPDGGSFYVVNRGNDEISRFDAETFVQMAEAPAPDEGFDIAVNPSTGLVYVTGDSAADLREYQADLNMYDDIGGISAGMRGVAVSPDGSTVVVASASGDFSSIDAASHVVTVHTLGADSMGCSPAFVAYAGAERLALTCNGISQVRIYNTATWDLEGAPIAVGAQPWDVTTGYNSHIFVVNRGDSTISLVDLNEWAVVGTLAVGADPWGIANQADTKRLFVTGELGNTLTVWEEQFEPNIDPTTEPTPTESALASTGNVAMPAFAAGLIVLVLAGALGAVAAIMRRRTS